MEDTQVDNGFFEAYSKKIKEEEAKRAEAAKKRADKQNGEGGSTFKFDEIQYVGTDKGKFLLLRFLGLPIGSEAMGYTRKPTDPKEIIQLELKDSKGKKFTVNLPLHAKDDKDEHILFRIYNKVTESVKVGDAWVPKWKDKFPELYELVTKGGFTKNDGNSYTYANGLKGIQVTIYNVFDRGDDWCKNNKHSKILCRDLNIDDQNRVWPKPGIKSYSLLPLGKLIAKYGLTEGFDVAMKRTGIQNNPYVILNASRLKEREMVEDLENDDGSPFPIDKIVIGPLSSEEKSWELYNLDKYYSPTKYSKIYERFGRLFELCDADLGTHYTDEIKGYIAQEEAEAAKRKAAREAEAEAGENAAINAALDKIEAEADGTPANDEIEDATYAAPKAEAPATEAPKTEAAPSFDSIQSVNPTEEVQIEAPTRSRSQAKAEAASAPNTDKFALLKGYNNLTDELKNRIVDVVQNGDKVEIVWDRKDDLLRCDTCGALSPESATHCPVCGVKF